MDFLSDLGRRFSYSTDDHRESAFSFSDSPRFNSALQCGRCFGYLCSHNPEDERQLFQHLFWFQFHVLFIICIVY